MKIKRTKLYEGFDGYAVKHYDNFVTILLIASKKDCFLSTLIRSRSSLGNCLYIGTIIATTLMHKIEESIDLLYVKVTPRHLPVLHHQDYVHREYSNEVEHVTLGQFFMKPTEFFGSFEPGVFKFIQICPAEGYG